MLGAPFKPPFGLSGIMALYLPLPMKRQRKQYLVSDPWRGRQAGTLPSDHFPWTGVSIVNRKWRATIPLKPKDGLNGAPSICFRCDKKPYLRG
jgi:hypothetical protein